MKYEVYTLVGGAWRSRGEVNAASAEQAARIFSLRSGHRLVRVKPEGRLGEYKVFDFTRKKNPMARKRRKIKRNPRRTRRVKTWAKRVKRHRRKHNTVGRGFYTPAGRAVYGYLKSKRNPSMRFKDLPIGASFEFDHSGLSVRWSGATGPWIKSGPRSYYKPEDIERQKEINRVYGLKGKFRPHRVGSINVKVIS